MSEFDSRTPFIELTGRLASQRFEIKVNGRPAHLSGTSFFYLFQLAFYALLHPGSWVKKEQIEETDNVTRYIYRLRKELCAIDISLSRLIENNRNGCYRLNVKADECGMDLAVLFQHPDQRIKSGVMLLVSKTTSPSIAQTVNS